MCKLLATILGNMYIWDENVLKYSFTMFLYPYTV